MNRYFNAVKALCEIIRKKNEIKAHEKIVRENLMASEFSSNVHGSDCDDNVVDMELMMSCL